ncbi:MAG: Glycosyltransferase [candidate division WWE3 bacterium GW2011_GWF2_41_45]|uniref:Glycosyltransferase subfamily 4-like N-terminal domain-containing protein n=3 Tax=Katanobacteria TaxID=422282 RepID=A0A1F4W3N4_UNCKA|nr:MAG: Glycosyltransferase [candidate division WWE3 bacterium GW2011_GWC2_41_23]KKS10808.1 MAG: Glycosyltransferase [candidate division WWE3 bacterium GW2011_GWF2_41_45]KKS20137.1 MAG: Glycosyltransferase [candidate division WWE3 bacterium GW2011_GWE1_41_72]KKS28497.1 MAG: Glycosyltransferase [candidate division WWE3 bacterium GW2011_GWC1_42_102]KKS29814.1 MAG: Glycosyltransferase [candidate division WWE3 bacterium GW2011_GWD2_42_11]KKS51379.1 MAG: Glycosyltransferase [candidate division WWE3
MEPKKKNVLIICPFFRPNIGGVETHLDRLIEYLGKNGYYSIVLTYQPLATKIKGARRERGENYEIHRVQWFGVGLFEQLETKFPLVFAYVFPGLFIKSIIFYLVNHKHIHVIHAHGLVAATIGVFCKLLVNKRMVVSTHAIYSFENRKRLLKILVWSILSFYDKILAVSEVSKQELIKIGLPARRIEAFRNWVDTDVFKPRDRQKLSITSDKKINYLMVARFIEKKGVLLYLKAAERIKDANFYLVGAGQLQQTVDAVVSKSANVKYMGVLNQSDPKQCETLLDLYSLADYFVSPYLYDEGYSITLCEAVSTGTIPVIPERGSPPTFLSKEVAHYMPAQIDAEILTNTLQGLLAQPKTQESINKCRQYALQYLGFSNATIITNSYESNE